MQTRIFKISSTDPDPKIIKVAAEIIRNNGLVAFPTETVYGLGANALDRKAAGKIFKAKNRPADNPLIVHIAEKEDLKKVAKDIPDIVWKLADVFWPGPLTFVLKKTENIPLITSGGLNTVAVRMPNHGVALELIKQAGVPIAAPSANISTRPSPTAANHVYDDLAGKVDCVLDAGEVSIGIESTVIDPVSDKPAILRPGAITAEMLSQFIPNLLNTSNPDLIGANILNFQTRSPGTKYKHYAPDCGVILFVGNDDVARKGIAEAYAPGSQKIKCWVIAQKKIESIPSEDQHILANAQEYARSIFSIFREAEKQRVDVIFVQGLKEEGIGVGVMNRLRKAATKIF